ncbi:MAG: XDD4 family exosortase-dependent surface protein [Nostoc sp.]|uniref:XDD4 family exosortase-dependent surface protein n=1 Tax=Nostoc sp. TaxID=1180 RepID=UPI002FFCCC75
MSQPYSKKIAGYAVCCISALAVVTVSQISQADAASMTFSVTGTNSASNNALASSVVFDDLLNPGKLTVTLTNMKNVSVPSDVLTSVFWDYAGSPLNLSLISATASKVTQNNPSTTTNNVNLLNTPNNGKEWAFASTTNSAGLINGVTQDYGLGTVGLGIFQGIGGQQQVNYGIIDGYNANANSPVKGGSFVDNSATFVLSGLPTNFDISKIGSVRFQYGTDLKEPSIIKAQGSYYSPPPPTPKKVPEPGTTAALSLFAVGALRGVRKKSLAVA